MDEEPCRLTASREAFCGLAVCPASLQSCVENAAIYPRMRRALLAAMSTKTALSSNGVLGFPSFYILLLVFNGKRVAKKPVLLLVYPMFKNRRAAPV